MSVDIERGRVHDDVMPDDGEQQDEQRRTRGRPAVILSLPEGKTWRDLTEEDIQQLAEEFVSAMWRTRPPEA